METVTMNLWGKDHWSVLAYIETCVVDRPKAPGIGQIDHARMSVNPERHPLLAQGFRRGGWKPEYSTRLRGYFDVPEKDRPKLQVPGHDDFDCTHDLEAAGLVEWISEINGFIRLTEAGIRMCGLLRAHKANGGHFATFVAPATETA